MEDTFEAIGTHWYISAQLPKGVTEQYVKQSIHRRIKEYEHNYSRFIDDSLVSTIAKSAGNYTMPADFSALYTLYKKLYQLTSGAMTPLIGQALSDAGYDASYSLVPRPNIADTPAFDDVISYTTPTLRTMLPVLLDFGAAGKGYLVDHISAILVKYGCQDFIIDASGDMHAQGQKTYTIGLENPFDITEAIGVTTLQDQSLCASAGSRRAWANYSHNLNPHTKKSPTHIAGVWVKADSTMLADALTTALLFADAEQLAEHFNFESFVLFADGSHETTAHFNAELYI